TAAIAWAWTRGMGLEESCLAGSAAAALAADGALGEAAPSRGAAGYTLVSGYAWVTNDAVNLLSGIAVVVLGLLVALP
ncbi:hypothetical protein, partial [Gordonibacter urolithinfaciens]|uniref:hypothetical protein n=1 Tax=Gordonibacter urolithinfaciens TaxID=1335613 RepID=UPI003AB01D4E